MKSKLTFYFLLTLLMLGWSSGLVAQTYSGGGGTAGDPYLIANKADLKYLSENTGEWAKHFKQTANIVFEASDFASGGGFYNGGLGFIPIGNGSPSFTGSYDGDHFTITGLYINRPSSDFIGMFGRVSYPGMVKNTDLINVNINGWHYVGGLLGYNNNCSVTDSYTTGSVSGYQYVGGLVGFNGNYSQITNCHSDANVNGTNYAIGGLVGFNYHYCTISGSYATGTVSGVHAEIGGLVGTNYTYSTVTTSYATGTVSGGTSSVYVGGLVGLNLSFSTVTESFSTGAVSGYYSVGGFAGYNGDGSSNISDCFTRGNVTRSSGGNTNFGGFVGYMYSGTIQRSYSTGSVSGNSWAPTDKGFVGFINSGTFSYNYWDVETSGQSSSVGQGPNLIEGKTTAEMKTQSTFITWDFTNTWGLTPSVNDGYPYLQYQCVNPATAEAGDNQSICQGGSALLAASIGGSATSAVWDDGNVGGSFSPNNSTLNATYTPPGSYTGSITLTLTTDDPAGNCSSASDFMVLTVNALGRRYVTVSGAGSQNGLDWANAYAGSLLQFAINNPCATEVWVAAGTYHPTVMVGGGNNPTDRHKTFQMRNGVPIYGGFEGDETDIAQRTDYGPGEVNETILSGDLNNDDDYSTTPWQNIAENCYHVFYHPAGLNLNNTAILDGFTIKGGNADDLSLHYTAGGMYNSGSSPKLDRVCFLNNSAYGSAGAFYVFGSSPIVENSFFRANLAGGNGGAIYLQGSASPVFTNCLITNNKASNDGGGIYNASSETPLFNNATIADNHASNRGGGVYHNGFVVVFRNSILWGNMADASSYPGKQFYNNTSNAHLQYTCFSNGTGDINGSVNLINTINSNPLFVDPVNKDYRIKGASPCADSGNDADNTLLTDIRGAGFGRKLLKTDYLQPGTIDMGAYEYNSNTDPIGCTYPNFTICPTPISVNAASGLCSAVVSYTVTANGNPTPTITYGFTGDTQGNGSGTGSGSTFNTGTTTVTVTATNTCGSATCIFTVTVIDTQPPTIVCATDVSINVTPGLCTGTTTLTPPTMSDNCTSIGNALHFDGGNDMITTTASGLPQGSSPRTVEAWIKTTQTSIGNFVSWGTRTVSNRNSVAVRDGKAAFIGEHRDVTGNITVNNGQWHHVACTYDGVAITLYVDGVLDIQSNISINTTGQNLLLGTIALPSTGEFYNGTLDEVRIWNVARTQAQIQANMNNELNAQEELLAVYHFNQGLAGENNAGITTALDASGNGFDGTLNNFALIGSTSNWVVGKWSDSILSNNAPSTYPIGNTTVTWTATDAAGNTATCNQLVTVIDNEAPVPDVTNLPDVIGVCQVNSLEAPTASDNCAGTVTGTHNASLPITADGTTVVTWTYNDGNGNTSTQNQNVVLDNFTPGSITGTGETICYGGTPSVIGTVGGWFPVGNPGFSADYADYTSLDLDGSGTPYVAYSDGDDYKATVMRYNSVTGAWETVGDPGFSADYAEYISLALDGSGTPYVAYMDSGNDYKATVMRYNSVTGAWETVGDPGFSADYAEYISLALDGSGTPYVAYGDYGNDSKATVMKYNSATGAWENVGDPGFSAGEAYYTSLALDASGNPYVAYMDEGIDYSYKATVMRYNSTDDIWETVGTAGFSAGEAYYTSLALDAGTPYVAYRDDGNNRKATVMKFNGLSWENVGDPGFSEGRVYNTSLAVDGSGTPYVAYRDRVNDNKATVMKFNGSNWENVADAGFSADYAYYTSLALDGSGTPFVAYQDGGNDYKATVMKFVNGNAIDASGGDGNITYEWRSSEDGYASPIDGANASTYTPPAVMTETTSYRRYAHDGTCQTDFVQTTGTWTVTVEACCTNPTDGGTIEDDQTICHGDQPAPLTNVTLPAGHAGGELQYQWQSSVTGESSGFSDIPGANSTGYTPGPLSVTTWFKRLSRTSCMGDWTGAAESNVIAVTMKPVYSISGTLMYYKAFAPEILLNGITLELQDEMGYSVGSPVTTSGGGLFTFTDVCPGDYFVKVVNNPKTPGGINATDAAQTNWWSVSPYTVEQARFQAGDGSFDWYISSADALAMQNYFVNGVQFPRNTNHEPPSPWTYFKAGTMVFSNSNPGPPNPPSGLQADMPVSVTNASITGYDIYAVVIGDFNTSFNPQTGTKGIASETLLLTYGETNQAEAGAEVEIPVRIVNASELTAASLILNYPEELLEVTGVSLKLENGNLDWSAKGGELRIGWNSLTPLKLEANSLWLSIQGRTAQDCSEGDEIRFTLAPDLLNELADANYNVIPDAVIGIDVLAFSSTGTPENDQSTMYNVQCTMNAHPNPFANFTSLVYKLPAEGTVTLEITDLLGRRVALMEEGRQISGKYSVKLDATPLQPGVYMATLKCGDLVKTIKLVREQ